MLSRKEEGFIEYWEENRLKKKKVFRQLSLGLPLGVVLVSTIFLNFFSGWYKRATIALKSEDASLILVLLAAAILIVAFIVIFSIRHKWEMNEQYYRELLARKEKSTPVL